MVATTMFANGLLAARFGGVFRIIGQAVEGDPWCIAIVGVVILLGFISANLKSQKQHGV